MKSLITDAINIEYYFNKNETLSPFSSKYKINIVLKNSLEAEPLLENCARDGNPGTPFVLFANGQISKYCVASSTKKKN